MTIAPRVATIERHYRPLLSAPAATVDAPAPLLAYYDRPDAFVLEGIRWPAGQGPTPHQLVWLRKLVSEKRLSARGPHGIGKTSFNAWIVLWFALTRDAARVDWK